MRYVRLGNTGTRVSELCLGCMSYGDPAKGWHPWVLTEEQSRPFLQKALEAGINFFDTANAYSDGESEVILGRAVRDFAAREDVVVATKVFLPMRQTPNGKGLSRTAILREVDASLRRLGTDYIDLYQIHRFDPETPVEETLEALHELVRAGKVRYLGGSTMHAYQFAKMLSVSERRGWARFATMQPQYNLIYREEEREMLPLCLEEKIGVLPWSPLARGKLTRPLAEQNATARSQEDKIARKLYEATEEADSHVIEAVGRVAAARGVPMTQVALAWVRQQPAVTTPIVGATKLHHLDDALASLELTLTGEELSALEQPYVPHALSMM